MVDLKYETRPFAVRFPNFGQENGCDNTRIPPHMAGYNSSFEDANIGGCGDQLVDLECRLAASLSKELLSALDAPTQRPLPDFERSKVACLKNAILELKRENDALHQELWKIGCSQLNEDDRSRSRQSEQPPRPRSARGPAANEFMTRRSERDVACQTATLKRHDRTSRSRESITESATAEPGNKNHAQNSNHSKCVDWLKRKKLFDAKHDQLHLVRLALRQLWELADRALTQSGSSVDDLRVQCPENTTEDDGENDGKASSHTGHPSNEVEQLRLQLAHLQQSKDRLKRRRDEQAILLRQKEMQVSRLQRSRSHLMHTFKNQLLLLRQQQTIEFKALQLQMQTERANTLAGQTAEMEKQLQGAVEQLEERYRSLLRDAFEKKKDSKRNSRPGSQTGKHSREESGT